MVVLPVEVEVEEEVLVEVILDVGIDVDVDMNDGVLLGLEQIAPTQHTEPDREPPDAHSQDAQHPPFVQAPLTISNLRPVGLLHISQYIQVAGFSHNSLPE